MISTEADTLTQVAAKYKSQGYRVTLQPQPDQVPCFLRNWRPGLVAETADDHVVVEVKPRHALRYSEEVRQMADVVNRMPGWRFELILDESSGREEEPPRIPDRKTIEGYLQEFHDLRENHFNTSAFILAWVILEASLRYLAHHYQVPEDAPPLMPVPALIKELAHYGVITHEQQNFVVQVMKQVRNPLLHGFQTEALDLELLDEMQAMTHELLQIPEQAEPTELEQQV